MDSPIQVWISNHNDRKIQATSSCFSLRKQTPSLAEGHHRWQFRIQVGDKSLVGSRFFALISNISEYYGYLMEKMDFLRSSALELETRHFMAKIPQKTER